MLPVSVAIGQPIAHRLDHMLSGVQAQIVVKIFGEDLDTLRASAERLRARLLAASGLVDLQVEKQVLIPQLKVTSTTSGPRSTASRRRPSPKLWSDSRMAASVSQIVDGNRRFDVVMRLSDENRSTTGLQDLLVSTPHGFVPLRLLAEVEESDGPNQILRENGQRRIVVLANGDGRRDMARHHRRHPPRARRDQLPAGLHHRSSKAHSRRRKRPPARSASCRCVSLALIFIVLYSATSRRSWPSSSWATSRSPSSAA